MHVGAREKLLEKRPDGLQNSDGFFLSAITSSQMNMYTLHSRTLSLPPPWARENGCEWDARTCVEAARGGHLDVLQ